MTDERDSRDPITSKGDPEVASKSVTHPPYVLLPQRVIQAHAVAKGFPLLLSNTVTGVRDEKFAGVAVKLDEGENCDRRSNH